MTYLVPVRLYVPRIFDGSGNEWCPWCGRFYHRDHWCPALANAIPAPDGSGPDGSGFVVVADVVRAPSPHEEKAGASGGRGEGGTNG